MAIGPVARILAQIIVPVVAVLARAIPAAYGQALNNAKKAGVDASEAAVPVFGKRISRSEALQVLNITLNKKSRGQQQQQQQGEQTTTAEETLDPILIKKQYERYFEANDVKNGGSFYLQSKIFRANELLLQEFQQQEKQQRKDSIDANGKN
mmetsp:Transcript_12669/g.12463  ORF Transcript_12669/g.12463 Transcript_12669/m.12463 type:complete len:152 (+) Transcript_12669:360-815(+)